MPTPYTLKMADVCRQLGIAPQSVRRLLALGELRYAQFGPRGHLRFAQADIDEFLRRSSGGPTPATRPNGVLTLVACRVNGRAAWHSNARARAAPRNPYAARSRIAGQPLGAAAENQGDGVVREVRPDDLAEWAGWHGESATFAAAVHAILDDQGRLPGWDVVEARLDRLEQQRAAMRDARKRERLEREAHEKTDAATHKELRKEKREKRGRGRGERYVTVMLTVRSRSPHPPRRCRSALRTVPSLIG